MINMEKMKMPIIASIIAIALVATALGLGTMAYFSDSENAAITITTGNVDLQLSKTDSGPWYNGLSFAFPTGFAPGDTYTVNVWLRNMGTSGSRVLQVYGANLVEYNSPGDLSQKIDITKVGFYDISGMVYPGGDGTYYETGMVAIGGGSDYAIFGDAEAPLTVYEFCNSLAQQDVWGYMRFFWGEWADETDYLPADGSVRYVELEFTFNSAAGDEYQNDQITFDIVFLATDAQGYNIIWDNLG